MTIGMPPQSEFMRVSGGLIGTTNADMSIALA
ncbi:hypothetical protein FHR67_003139 [Xanthomonas arboricola]|nr:hypothetical protein [Xanthomonas campestris]